MATRSITLGHEFDLLHDDDEETVAGTPPQQAAIVVLDTGLNLCARRRGLPWFVGNQQPILIPRAGYGPPRRLLPDIWVHPILTPTGRSQLLLAADDPPALVIEVASPSTVARDADPAAPGNKVRAYEALGVAEYLVFDPVGDLLGGPVRAWRARAGGYALWEPDAAGHWASAALGVAFRPQGLLLRVYDQDSRLVPTIDEQDARIAELEQELRRVRAAAGGASPPGLDDADGDVVDGSRH
jgi:Uma2 family endonuclease